MSRPIALMSLLAGCGIPTNTPIPELDADDWTKICEDATADLPTADREVDCGQYTLVINPYTAEDCEADVAFLTEDCNALLADWQACFDAVQATDPCTERYPEICEVVDTCSSVVF